MTLIVSPKQFRMGSTTNRNNDKEGDDDETIDLDVSTESCVDGILSMVSSAPSKRMASGIHCPNGTFSGLRRKAIGDSSFHKTRIANRRNTDNASILPNSQRSRMVLAAMSSPQRRLFASQDVEREGDEENNVVLQWGTESIPVQVDISGSTEIIPKTLIASKIVFVNTRQIWQLKDGPSFSSSQEEGEIINWNELPKIDDDDCGLSVTSSSTSCWWRSLASWLSMIQATILFVTPSASSKKYLLYHSKFQMKLISLSSETSSAPTKKQNDVQIKTQSSLITITKPTTLSSPQVKKRLDVEEIGTRKQEQENEETTTRKVLLTWPEWSHACIRHCHTRKGDGEISTIPYLVDLCRQLPSIVFSMKSSSSVSRKDVLQSTIQLLSSTHCSIKKKEDGPDDTKTPSLLLWCNRIDILSIVQQRNEEQYEFLVKWLTMQICLRLTLLSKFGSKLLEKMVTKMKVTRELSSLLESLGLLIMNDSNINFTTVLLQLLDPSYIDRKCKTYLLNHFEIQPSISDEEYQYTIPLEEDSEQIRIQQTINQEEGEEEKKSLSRPKILSTTKSIIMTPTRHSLQSSNNNGGESKYNVSRMAKDTDKSAGKDTNSIQQFYSMRKQRSNNPLLQRQPPSSRRNKMMMVPPNLLQQVTTTTKSSSMESPISSPSRIASTFSSPRRRGPMMMLPPPASPASPYIATPPYYYKRVVMETPDQEVQGFRSPSSFCSDRSGASSTGTSIYDTPQKKRRQQPYSQSSKKRLPILAMESPELLKRQKKLKAANVVAQVNIAMRKQQQQKKDQDQQKKEGSPQRQRKIDFQDCD